MIICKYFRLKASFRLDRSKVHYTVAVTLFSEKYFASQIYHLIYSEIKKNYIQLHNYMNFDINIYNIFHLLKIIFNEKNQQ